MVAVGVCAVATRAHDCRRRRRVVHDQRGEWVPRAWALQRVQCCAHEVRSLLRGGGGAGMRGDGHEEEENTYGEEGLRDREVHVAVYFWMLGGRLRARTTETWRAYVIHRSPTNTGT